VCNQKQKAKSNRKDITSSSEKKGYPSQNDTSQRSAAWTHSQPASHP
jgi:hypothetical protein